MVRTDQDLQQIVGTRENIARELDAEIADVFTRDDATDETRSNLLQRDDFGEYQRNAESVRYVREVSQDELPKTIKVAWGDIHHIDKGQRYILIFDTRDTDEDIAPDCDDNFHQCVEQAIPHWSVEKEIFDKTYKFISEDHPLYCESDNEERMLEHGYRPAYKPGSDVAMQVPEGKVVLINSLEHAPNEYSIIPAGYWVLIGVDGEPYYNDPEYFEDTHAIT